VHIYLIRHTTPDIDKGLCYGQADVGLAQLFEKEKDEILAKMPDTPDLQVVYTSPLHRCIRLAGILNGLQVVVDERLLEMSFGEWELKNWNDIDPRALDTWMADFVEQRPPGGESLRMLYQRVGEHIEQLLHEPFDSVAVVTHAGVIRCFWAHIAGIPLMDLFNIEVDYGEVFLVQTAADTDGASISRLP
jgi:alpha-ribazole phosphatase